MHRRRSAAGARPGRRTRSARPTRSSPPTPACVLVILVADCVPVVLFDPEAQVLACAHAGWRGALAGVLEATIAAMRSLGATAEPDRRAASARASAPDRYQVGRRSSTPPRGRSALPSAPWPRPTGRAAGGSTSRAPCAACSSGPASTRRPASPRGSRPGGPFFSDRAGGRAAASGCWPRSRRDGRPLPLRGLRARLGPRAAACASYSLGPYRFTEETVFDAGGDWSTPGASTRRPGWCSSWPASRTTRRSPRRSSTSARTSLTEPEEHLLSHFYRDGPGEFAYRNGLDLSDVELRIERRRRRPPPPAYRPGPGPPARPLRRRHRLDRHGRSGARPLRRGPPVRRERRREPLRRHRAARRGVTGLPGRARQPDASTRSCCGPADLGFQLGHVPITGILSAVAAMAAVLGGHDTVVMSNEWSASSGTSWSTAARSTTSTRRAPSSSGRSPPSWPRRWVTGSATSRSCAPPASCGWPSRFASLGDITAVFHSCNRAFATDPAAASTAGAATCDKCCFIDLILAAVPPGRGARQDLRRARAARPTRRSRASSGPSSAPSPTQALRVRGRRRRVPGRPRPGRGPTRPGGGRPPPVAGRRDARRPPPPRSSACSPRSATHAIPDDYAPDDQLV